MSFIATKAGQFLTTREGKRIAVEPAVSPFIFSDVNRDTTHLALSSDDTLASFSKSVSSTETSSVVGKHPITYDKIYLEYRLSGVSGSIYSSNNGAGLCNTATLTDYTDTGDPFNVSALGVTKGVREYMLTSFTSNSVIETITNSYNDLTHVIDENETMCIACHRLTARIWFGVISAPPSPVRSWFGGGDPETNTLPVFSPDGIGSLSASTYDANMFDGEDLYPLVHFRTPGTTSSYSIQILGGTEPFVGTIPGGHNE